MTATFYVVGGAVRDALLGGHASDRDWVAVGTTPEELLALATSRWQGLPGLHPPADREEVALARHRTQVGPGYHGFAFHAAPRSTLEETWPGATSPSTPSPRPKTAR